MVSTEFLNVERGSCRTSRVWLLSLALSLSLVTPALAQVQPSPSPQFIPAANDLAAALARTTSEEEQERLLIQEQGLVNSSLLAALKELTDSLILKSDYAQALRLSQLAARIAERIGDRRGLGDALSRMGVAYSRQNRAAQALDYLQKSLIIFEEAGDKKGMALALEYIGVTICVTLKNLGLLYHDTGNYTDMLEVSRRAARLAEEINAPDELWIAQDGIGRALRALGQPAQARESFLAAIATIESLRHQIAGGVEQQQSFLENKLSPWLDLIDLLISQHEYAEALSFAEQSKARVLLDVLEAGRPSLLKSLSPQEQQTEEKQRLQLVALNSQLTSELRRDRPDLSRVAELKAAITKARLEYEALETDLYVAHPELRVHRGEASIIKTEELT